MTTIDSSPEQAAGSSTIERLLAADVDWLTSTDSKKTGRLFVGAGLLGLLATVVVNILIAVERLDGADVALDADAWVQLFSAQRFGLVFGAALPIGMGLALAAVPLQVGARSIAFPRLAQMGFFMWFGGFVLAYVAIVGNGGFGGDSDMIDLFLAAHGLMVLGLLAGAASVVTTVLTTRAPGMTMRRVPFFAFSAFIYGIGLLLVLPVLLGSLVYLFVDHRSGAGLLFESGVSEYAQWAFGQPTSFLYALPLIGLLAELLPVTFAKRTPFRGLMLAGLSLIGIAALAGSTQQTVFEVPWAGSQLYIGDSDDVTTKLGDLVPWALFHLLPLLGAGIVLLMTLFMAKPERGARVNFTAAFPFAVFGFFMILVGMAGAALLPIVDLGLLGTVFDEAVLVYVVYGLVLGAMGAIVYWAPKLWGVELPLKAVTPLAFLGFLATIAASFPHYIAGFLGQEAGFAYSDSDMQIWNIIVLVGHALMALTVVAFVGLLAKTALGRDDDAIADDPFDAHTIEWATTSPAPADNFVDVPMITSAEPLLDAKEANRVTEGSDS